MPSIIFKSMNKNYSNDSDIARLIMYIAGKGNNEYCEEILALGSRGLSRNPETAAKQLIRSQERVNKATKRRVMHIIISFSEDCINIEAIKEYASQIADAFSKGFQLIYAIHSSTDNIHIHYAINRVNIINGHKTHWSKSDFLYIRNLVTRFAETKHLNYRVVGDIQEFLDILHT